MKTTGGAMCSLVSVHVVAVDIHIFCIVFHRMGIPWDVAFTHIKCVGYHAVFVYVRSAIRLFLDAKAILQPHVCVQHWRVEERWQCFALRCIGRRRGGNREGPFLR